MNNPKDKFFTFPITLLSGFMTNTEGIFDKILYFCAYEHYIKFNNIEKTKTFFTVKFGNEEHAMEQGKVLSESTPKHVPWTSCSVNMYWSYRNENDNFSKATFLAFLAIKSIIGDKPYYKTSQVRIFKRMAGMTDAFSDQLPDDIAPWCERYKFNRIKDELQESFGVTIYANHSRGIYVSTKLNLQKLIEAAERNKLSYRSAKKKHMTEEAYRKAMAVVNSAAPKLST